MNNFNFFLKIFMEKIGVSYLKVWLKTAKSAISDKTSASSFLYLTLFAGHIIVGLVDKTSFSVHYWQRPMSNLIKTNIVAK